jgi:PAS domain S-box-containing protein
MVWVGSGAVPGIAGCFLAVRALLRRDARTNWPVPVLLVLYGFASAWPHFAPSLAVAEAAEQWSAAAFAPLLMAAWAQSAPRGRRAFLVLYVGLAIVVAGLTLAPWFAPAGAWRSGSRLDLSGDMAALRFENGPLRWAWASLLFAVGTAAFAQSLLFRRPSWQVACASGLLLLAVGLEAARPWTIVALGPWAAALATAALAMAHESAGELQHPVAREQAFDHMGEGVLVVDADGTVVDANPALAQLFSVDLGRISGRKLSALSFGSDLIDLLGQTGYHELEIWEAGRERFLGASVRSLPRMGRNQGGTVLVLNDITERKVLERSLLDTSRHLQVLLEETERLAREAQAANEAKSRYLATISHEIRTPLNGLIGMTELLQRTELTPEQREQAKNIQACGETLLRLVNDVLDISKIEAGHMTLESVEFDLIALLDDVAEPHRVSAQQKGVNLHVSRPQGVVPLVYGDPLRIRQILHNLLSNAVRFTERGFIRLILETKPTAPGFLQAMFIVSDTGIGIEPDRIYRIFEDYEQADSTIARRYGGTGLGLGITKQLVDLMGGKITVRSKLGEGSQFQVDLTLPVGGAPVQNRLTGAEAPESKRTSLPDSPVPEPVRQEKPRPREKANLAEKGAFSRLRVLVAEDDEVSILVVSGQLDFLGCQYEIARDGAQAVRLARTSAFDIVFMDMHMPVMGGLDATREMRAAGVRVPILAMTAAVMDDEVQACLDAGMNGVVTKPISGETIARALAEYTGDGAKSGP